MSVSRMVSRRRDQDMDRRSTMLGVTAALAAPALLRVRGAAAQGVAPVAQAPGFYRFRVGGLLATVVHDGFLVFPDAGERFVRNAPRAEVEAAMRAGGLDPAAVRVPFNITFLETPAGLVVFDAGTGGQLTPQSGSLHANMRAAGLDPLRVSTVVITHFHVDHIHGLTTRDGAAVFPDAELVVPEAEWAFWMNDGAMSRAPEPLRPVFANARRRFAPYASRVRRIGGDAEVMPGIRSIGTPGHTPGHTSYLVTDGAAGLLVLGDVSGRPELTLSHPDWHTIVDMDGPAAVASRRRLLDRAAGERIRAVGYHWPFPANGHVTKDGARYALTPAEWTDVV